MSQHLAYVVSDLHLGPGRDPRTGELDPLEDFEGGSAFSGFLETIGANREPVELVIAGDFLEYPQTLPELGLRSPADHLGATEAESLARTKLILGLAPQRSTGHPEVFSAMRRFIGAGHTITIIVGNHDLDLLWPSSWKMLFDQVYQPGSAGWLRRRHFSHQIGNAYIEHGHEHDPANRFGDRMEQPFLRDESGTMRLKRCWGTLFVDEVYNQLERERWFIDNVKPIPRVIKMGLANDFRFTARAMGLIVRFLLTSGLPPRQPGDGGLLGAAEPANPSAEDVATQVADPELRRYLERHLDDPALRNAVEGAVADLDTHEWAQVSSGSAQATLETASGQPSAVADGLLGGGSEESAYRRAARAALEAQTDRQIVIMGHTHAPIDGYVDPIDLADGRMGYYFNSGTWTRHLKDEANRTYTWQEIADPNSYTSSFTYLELEPHSSGYRAVMRSFR